MRLLETDATQFDTELLDIYLTEAGEVLDTIATSAEHLAAHSDDRDGADRRAARISHPEGQRPHGGPHRSG